MIVSIVEIQHERGMIWSGVATCKSEMIRKTGMVFSTQLVASLLKQLELGHRIRSIKFRLDNTVAAIAAAVVSCSCLNS